jgi:predicted nucleotidyltransferase component of viral defense system
MSNFLAKVTVWLDDHTLLREAISRTARDTGFASPLVEKDFFCSVALEILGRTLPEQVVFKGGTCLSKVYTDFYRLSEDLDFTIPVPLDSERRQRRALIEPVRDIVDTIQNRCTHLSVRQVLRGANRSTQYVGVLEYESRIDGRPAEIKIEFGLREPSLCSAVVQDAATLLLNPITGKRALSPVPVRAMASAEVWAEKVRAALTRREAAIRDFFDLDYALRQAGVDLRQAEFRSLVRQKISLPGTKTVQLTPERRADLDAQISTKLRPVLRTADRERFDLNRIWHALLDLAEDLKE